MSVQGDILREAIKKIEGDRNKDYGAPHTDFERTAGMLNSLGYRGPGGREITGPDWAIILICGKLSRLVESPNHEDSVQDIAGYAGCYWEAEEFVRQTAATAESDVAIDSVIKSNQAKFTTRLPVISDAKLSICTRPETTPGRADLCPGGGCGDYCQITGFAKNGSRQRNCRHDGNGGYY